jgi:hypothetical protein
MALRKTETVITHFSHKTYIKFLLELLEFVCRTAPGQMRNRAIQKEADNSLHSAAVALRTDFAQAPHPRAAAFDLMAAASLHGHVESRIATTLILQPDFIPLKDFGIFHVLPSSD